MDCNKEEAIRARDIAEKKMQSKDFNVARKIAIKAQQLYPDLENISQMLMVCNVHCSSEQKLFGSEMDWYGILQVEQTANEAMIKKQYRKFALSLHPDKNKFPGAEAAFKLIGEAQRVLLDRDKRTLHDMRRKSSVLYHPPQKATSYAGAGIHSNYRNNAPSMNPMHQQPPKQTQSGFSGSNQTFWTVCPFCSVRYQYFKEVVNRSLRCQNCEKPFVAYDINAPGFQPPNNLNCHATFSKQKDIPNQHSFKANVGNQGKTSVDNNPRTRSFKKVDNSSGTAAEKPNQKMKRKQAAESSESCDTGSSSDFEEDRSGVHSLGHSGEHNPRRSTRHRQEISYTENLSDDEDFASRPNKVNGNGSHFSSKKSKTVGAEEKAFRGDLGNGARIFPNKTDDNNDREKCSEDFDNSKSDSSTQGVTDMEAQDCPDADFNDFDKAREEDSFKVGQIWSVYDDLHAMPRYYARIKKVFSAGFKVEMTWLEPDPDDEDKIKWVREGLPVSCGKYKLGKPTKAESLPMFSNLVIWEKGNRRDRFEIYPRNGETWAIFRNWDSRWNFNAEGYEYEYDIVEVLTDYTQGSGIRVAFLSKIKGFKSLFCRKAGEGNEFQVLPSELYIFSHRIPSFVMTGEEREDVPKGSLELDPAALPTDLEEFSVPERLKDETANISPTGMCGESSENLKCWTGLDENVSDKINSMQREEDPSTPEAIEIPTPEFYNFAADKSPEKFQVNQIWALYGEEDGLPKYYGQIKKVFLSPEFLVDIVWLSPCGLPNNTSHWHDEKMPISCGTFKNEMMQFQSFTSPEAFSQLVKPDSGSKRREYLISPRKGEIWAVYQNWTAEIRCSDLENCKYDVVEVVNEDDLHIQVLRLERVDGLKSVFQAQVKEGSPLLERISRVELLQFSHQIPAFRLTDERGGNVRGCLELDPAALPVHYFS